MPIWKVDILLRATVDAIDKEDAENQALQLDWDNDVVQDWEPEIDSLILGDIDAAPEAQAKECPHCHVFTSLFDSEAGPRGHVVGCPKV